MFNFHCNKLFSLFHFCADNLFWFKMNADVYFFDEKQNTNLANDQKRSVKTKIVRHFHLKSGFLPKRQIMN